MRSSSSLLPLRTPETHAHRCDETLLSFAMWMRGVVVFVVFTCGVFGLAMLQVAYRDILLFADEFSAE